MLMAYRFNPITIKLAYKFSPIIINYKIIQDKIKILDKLLKPIKKGFLN